MTMLITAGVRLQRPRSRDAHSFADRLLAAMRNEFGGRAIRRE